MTKDEKAAFEIELQQNLQLKLELQACQKGIENLKEIERIALKKRLQKLEQSLSLQKNDRKPNYIFWIVPLAISILILLWCWNSYNISKIQSEKYVPIVRISDSILLDSHTVSKLSVIPEKDSISEIVKVPKLNNTITEYEDLYTMNFKTYTNDEIEFEVRGLGEKSEYELYKYYYNINKFDEVIFTFEKLSPELKENDLVLLMRANAFMNNRKFDLAIQDLKLLTLKGESIFVHDAFWYLALCYLKEGKVNKVKSILNHRFLREKPIVKALISKL